MKIKLVTKKNSPSPIGNSNTNATVSSDNSEYNKLNELIKHVSKMQAPKSDSDIGPRFKWNIYKHGLTQSMISNFRKCERKFRLSVDGLASMADGTALVYGSVFHTALDICQNIIRNTPDEEEVIIDYAKVMEELIQNYADEYNNANPEAKESYELSYGWTEITLPRYFKHWKQDFFGDTKKEFVEIEEEFCVNFQSCISPERVVPLRGKRDGLVREGGQLWLWENKTKGTWNEYNLAQIVERDLQNNTYILSAELSGKNVKGIIYNIIRRPQLRRTKKESMKEYLDRCAIDIDSRPEFYFLRLQVDVSEHQRTTFKAQMARQVALMELWYSNIYLKSPFLDIENTNECDSVYGACTYLGLCSSGLKEFQGLRVKDEMFSELDTANIGVKKPQ